MVQKSIQKIEKIFLHNYDAAMAELLADRPYIQKILKEHGII